MRKIKVFLTFFLLVYLANISFAQQGFELIIDNDMESGIVGSKSDNLGNIVFTGIQYFPDLLLTSVAFVAKVSPIGDTLLRSFNLGTDTLCNLFGTMITQSNEYIILGAIGKPESNHKKFKNVWVIKLDENLNTIWDKRYPLAGNYWNPQFEVAMDADSMIYLVGEAAIDGMTYDQHLFMMKFNLEGDTLKTNYPFFNGVTKDIYGIIQKYDNNGVIVFGDNFDYNATAMQALDIDSNLNYTVHPIYDPLSSASDNATAHWLTDSTYLLSCRATNENNGTFYNNDIELMLMNNQHQIMEQHWAGRPDTNDYPAWRTSMDFTDKNNIWVSGSIEHFPDSPMDAHVLVYLLDSTLNIKGQKYYGGDMNYSANTTTATTDGGCVLGGTVYDWQNSFAEDVDLWIKKIFPPDLITHAEDTPDPYDSDVLVYPNPAIDRVFLSTIRQGLEFHLYNLTGQAVLRSDIDSGKRNQIDISKIPQGFYIYSITRSDGKTIDGGKILKQ